MNEDYGISNIDTALIDPLSELQVQGLIVTEKKLQVLVPRPTEKFYTELEQLLKTSEFQFLDLDYMVRRIIAKYEPVDVEMYSVYLLVAMANCDRWIRSSDKPINPAMILRADNTLQRIIAEYNVEIETT